MAKKSPKKPLSHRYKDASKTMERYSTKDTYKPPKKNLSSRTGR